MVKVSRSIFLVFAFLAVGGAHAVAAGHAWDGFVGNYICSVAKAYDIGAGQGDPTEVALPKAALSFTAEISLSEPEARRSDCSWMARILKENMAEDGGTADWSDVNVRCNSVLELKQELNNGFGAIEEDYHFYGPHDGSISKSGIDFEVDGGNRFHLSPDLSFTITSPFADGSVEFIRGSCARLKDRIKRGKD